MKRSRGHYCRVCGCMRPNEAFSGRGHARHICRECQKIPKDELAAMEQEREIRGFLDQSNISDKNLRRLAVLAASKRPRIAAMAAVVLEVARVKPAKRRRLKLLFQKHPILIARLEEIGLIAPRRDWGAEDDLDARDPWWLDSENEPFADTDFGAERPDSFFTPADEDPRPPENHDFAVPQWPDMDAGRAYANLTSETGSIDWDEYDAFAGG